MRLIPFITLALITIAIAGATLIEWKWGPAMALSRVYHSPWMIGLWAVGAVSTAVMLLRDRRKLRPATMLFHCSLLLILAGAAVTHLTGTDGTATLPAAGDMVQSYRCSDGSDRELPFSLTLIDHGVEFYPGTDSPSDYYSLIDITGSDGTRQVKLSMNRFVDIDGYRLCQNSISGTTSTLTVNHDPAGTGLSYAGYILLFASALWMLLDPRGRFRTLARSVAVTGALLGCAFTSTAADTPEVLQRPLARSFGDLYIYNGDRVVPLSSYARDFCMKVHGSTSYRGFTPEQILTGFMFYYDDWKNEPFIKLKSEAARKAVGADGSFVALSRLGSRGIYLLEQPLTDNPGDTELARDNDRIGVVTAIVTGNALKIIPRKEGNSTAWLDPATAFTAEFEDASRAISRGRFNEANSHINLLRERQEQLAGKENIPSPARIWADKAYSATVYLLPAAILLILTGAAAMTTMKRRPSMAAAAASSLILLYLSWLMTLRWIAGNHIPLATGFETMMALSWLALLLSLAAWRRVPVVMPAGTLVAGCSLLVAAIGSRDPAIGHLPPVLSSPLLSVHVMLVMAAYSLLAIIALNSLAGLVRNSPSSAAVSMMLLYPAELLLAAGIFTGAIWANESWGRYWGWDPKESWALVTFFIYSLPLHRAVFNPSDSRRLNIYLTVALAAVLMTYLGVNYIPGGLHSYGAN